MSSLKAPPKEDVLMKRLLLHFSQDDLSISRFFSLMAVEHSSPMLNLIYSLKYRGMARIGYELGNELGKTMLHLHYLDFEVILPIPIHSARTRERGYNQATEICRGISEKVEIPILTNAIKRIRYTRTQTQMNARERKENVSGVFGPDYNSSSIHGKKILLVDDVLTTGSTLNSCATSLLDLGARQVNVATLAVAE
ncbi:MAG: ComF family protein [Ignavibacteria bacterium]|nr:ComF family protein [Ignavibacteria bacterium]